jgi:hypothetical protein
MWCPLEEGNNSLNGSALYASVNKINHFQVTTGPRNKICKTNEQSTKNPSRTNTYRVWILNGAITTPTLGLPKSDCVIITCSSKNDRRLSHFTALACPYISTGFKIGIKNTNERWHKVISTLTMTKWTTSSPHDRAMNSCSDKASRPLVGGLFVCFIK